MSHLLGERPLLAAVLLAGGKSKRWGQDKALLPWRTEGCLWQHQLKTLRGLEPMHIYWSGPVRDNLPRNLIQVDDPEPDCGPFAGILAALRQSTCPLLLALAVDLPFVSTSYLQSLWSQAKSDFGIVPKIQTRYEPLAAIYPRALLPLMEHQWKERRFSLQELMDIACHAGWMKGIPVSKEEEKFFINLNSPADLPPTPILESELVQSS